MAEIFKRTLSRKVAILALVVIAVASLIWAGSAYAQAVGRVRGRKAVTFFAQWYNERSPIATMGNLPPNQALYFYVLYDDGTIEKRSAP